MPAEFTNPDQPPEIPSGNFNFVVPETHVIDDKTREQIVPFSVNAFPEATSPDEANEAAVATRALIEQAFGVHQDFVIEDPRDGDKTLQLEKPTEDGRRNFIRMRSFDDGTRQEIGIFDPGGDDAHEYYVDHDGTLRRYDYNRQTRVMGLPKDGDVPMRALTEIRDRLRQKELTGRAFGETMGYVDKTVGTAEQQYITAYVDGAEPEVVPFNTLSHISNRLARSTIEVSPEEGLEAGEMFRNDIKAFLRREGYDPDTAGEITKDILDIDGFLHVRIGQVDKQGTLWPYVIADCDWRAEDNGEKDRETITYGLTDRDVLGYNIQLSTEGTDGALQKIRQSGTYPGDFTGAMAIRHFLRQPRVTVDDRPKPKA
ncbi:MAG TPA: hypothetical protein VHT70_01125 [Candidatus Saccharimonadales bacterium]|jgi:hypothetical protein|nr:hypothetical protein [Candidatus Saccharimonadales bacterium]